MAGALVDGLSTASATPAPNTIPKSDGAGKLDGWITGGAPTATQTAARIPLYNAAKGLNVDGISFPATQAASADANTLDDYEEGAITVTMTVPTSGTITMKAANNTLHYDVIGERVFISGYVGVDSVSSPVGDYVLVSGLPYAGATLAEDSGRSANSIVKYVSTFTIIPMIFTGSTNFAIRVAGNTIAANDYFYISFNYVKA